MPKREIKVRESVTLPSPNTDVPPREMHFIQFLVDWVLGAPGMRHDDALDALFEWEETLEAFITSLENGRPGRPDRPEPPPDPTDEQAAEYKKAVDEYKDGVLRRSVGQSIFVSEDAFQKAKAAAKAYLEDVFNKQAPKQWPVYETKILRHYHAFAQSVKVEEN